MADASEVFNEAAGPYGKAFFDNQAAASYRSSAAVMPAVFALVDCSSVVDVGCGVGSWLRTVEEAGIDDYLGIDGDYVSDQLCIPTSRFRAHDLRQPLDLGRRFDLAICVEVAEHLPAESATTLVDTLTSAAPFVVFSAAVPEQGGAGHVNERWPNYWGRLFWDRGYGAHDCLRLALWTDDRVEWWYRQNLMLFADRSRAPERLGPPVPEPLTLIHPAMIQAILTRPPAVDSASTPTGTAEPEPAPPSTDRHARPEAENRLWRGVQAAGAGVRQAVNNARGVTRRRD